MHKDKIINLGGMFNYIGKKILNLYKMVSKKIVESITLILTNSTGDDLIDYKIYGNSEQTSDPSPENPQEIKSVGDLVESGEHQGKYKIPVICSGKNNFNDDDFITAMSTHYQGKVTIDGKECIALGRKNSSTTDYTYLINGKVNTPYTISMKYTNNSCGMYFVYSDGTSSSNKLSTVSTLTDIAATSAENKTVVGIRISCYGWYSTGSKIQITDIQLEEGTSATEYEPYHDPITTNIYLDEPLSKINDYKDEIMKSSGKNIFDKNTLPHYNSNNDMVTVLDTGLKITDKASSSGNHYVNYNLFDMRGYEGKTLRMSCNFTKNASNGANVLLRASSGENNVGDAVVHASTSGTSRTITYTIPDDVSANPYLQLSLYSNYNGTWSSNCYVEYTNLIITIDNENMEYEPYGVDIWYLKKNIKKVVLDGSERYQLNDTDGSTYNSFGLASYANSISRESTTNIF